MTPWDNPTVDALVWALSILGLLWWLLRRESRRVARDPLAEPISHVRPATNLDAAGRVRKVGSEVHAKSCVDDEGRVECGCGLDDLAEEWLDANPDMSAGRAGLLGWGELHGEVGR